MKTQRVYQIMAYCINKNDVVTLKELADYANISIASIRLDMTTIEQVLKEYNVMLIRKRGVGYTFKGLEDDMNRVRMHVEKILHGDKKQDHDDLENCIIFHLLQHLNQYVRIADLAAIFYVSNSAIQKKLSHIRNMMNESTMKLEMVKNKGVRLLGSESEIRKLFAKMVLQHEVKATTTVHNQIDIKQQIFKTLHIQSEPIFIAIRKCEQEIDQIFSDEACNALAIHIAIAIKRVMDNKTVPHKEIINVVEYEKEYQAAIHLCENIGEHYQIMFNEDEIYYMFLHLISTKVVRDGAMLLNLKITDDNDVVKTIALSIVELVRNIKQITIKEKYIDNLILHLRPALNRLEYGMELTNPLSIEIRREYPEAYGIAWMSNTIFQRELNKDLCEDEIAYIAIHIQAMIESSQSFVKTVVVCSSGIGIAQLLATQIEKRFKRIDLVSIDSLATFKEKQYALTEVDLVISTFPIHANIPEIQVEPLLTTSNIQQIHNFIATHSLKGKKNEVLEKKILIHPTWTTQEMVIAGVSEKLCNDGYVKKRYEQSVWKREQICSTAIGMRVALPHGDFEQVIKSCVYIVTLEKSILWGDDEVDIVIFTVIAKDDVDWTTISLRNLYRKLYSSKLHDELIRAKSPDEVIRKLM